VLVFPAWLGRPVPQIPAAWLIPAVWPIPAVWLTREGPSIPGDHLTRGTLTNKAGLKIRV